jgi:hypothetical protein
LVHPVRDVLAVGLAGPGGLAHCLADLNPSEADRYQHWRSAGSLAHAINSVKLFEQTFRVVV